MRASLQRTEAAAAQIESLNPLVTLKAIPTLAPFTQGSTAEAGSTTEMAAFLTREKVDVVVACDMTRSQLVSEKWGSGVCTHRPCRSKLMRLPDRQEACFTAPGPMVSMATSLPTWERAMNSLQRERNLGRL